MEYGVPIMFDVCADSRDDAGAVLIEVLASLEIPGRFPAGEDPFAQDRRVESWWTIEAVDKRHDRNDNAVGEVLFDNYSPVIGTSELVARAIGEGWTEEEVIDQIRQEFAQY